MYMNVLSCYCRGDEQSPEKLGNSDKEKGVVCAELVFSSNQTRIKAYESTSYVNHINNNNNKIDFDGYDMDTHTYT